MPFLVCIIADPEAVQALDVGPGAESEGTRARPAGGGDFLAQTVPLAPGSRRGARTGARSAHPIESPPLERSPSVSPSIAGKEINCTDCHGNNNLAAPAGPHGSAVQFILRADYTTMDGSPESAAAYALCYGCHDRERVLDSTPFPLHPLHVVDERASCATCHSGHGSVENRSLIRFGEETFLGAVAPSVEAGRLAFVWDVPGSGTCYLSCHGRDHAPESYGGSWASRRRPRG